MMDVFHFRRRGGLWLFAAVFCVYMLSMTREKPWGDAIPMWEMANSLAYSDSVAIKTRWPGSLPAGREGKIYAVAPVLQGVVHIPGAVLQYQAQKHFPQEAQLIWRFTSHLATVLLGALTCLLFFGICRRAGAKPASAAITTLALALGTTIWVYSRYTYSEVLQAACFTGFFAQLLETRKDPSRRSGALLGMWAGLLVNAKYIYLASVAGAIIYLLIALRGRWRAILETALAAAVAAMPFIAVIFLYNFARWGSPFTAGYDLSSNAGIRENIAVGLWGMFLSPGKSVFLYSPPLLAALVALPLALRRWPSFMPAALLVMGAPILVYARLIFWSGDYAWGPRYLVFAVPVMLLPACLLVDDLLSGTWRWRRVLAASALGTLLLSGGFVQYLGNAFYWDHFIRIQRDASRDWLGTPNPKGNGMLDPKTGCGACFEDMHPMHWLPPFQPILGHLWMLHHVPYDDNWIVAEKDAPWRRYTSLQLNIASSWNRARFDWWFTEYRDVHPKISWVLILGLPFFTLLFFGLFLREVGWAARTSRRAEASPPSAPSAPEPYDSALTAST